MFIGIGFKPIYFAYNPPITITYPVEGAPGGGAALYALTRPTLGFIGDSRTQPFGDDAGGTGSISSASADSWQQPALRGAGHRVYVPPQGNTAIGGQGTPQVIPRLSAIVSLLQSRNIQTVWISLGRNDWSGVNLGMGLAATKANMGTIIGALRDANIRVILTNELPETGLTGTTLTERLDWASWLLDPARKTEFPNIIAQVDTRTAMLKGGTTNDYVDGYSADGVHLIKPGNLALGAFVGAQLNSIYSGFPVYALPTVVGDAYNAGTNPLGVLTSNFLLTGTTGTKGGTNPATGNVPTLWDITNSAAGISIVSSIATGGDGLAEWTITVSGTPTTANYQTFLVRRVDTTNAASLAAGDTLHACGNITVAASPTNLLGLGFGAKVAGSGGTISSLSYNAVSGASAMDGFGPAVTRSQEVIVPSDWATQTSRSIQTSLQVGMQGQSPVSFAITLKQIGTRKTPALA